jgi:hypothetical protein
MDDRGGGGLPRAGRRAKAPESGRMAAGEGCGATGNRAMLGLVERRWRAGLLGDGEPATWGRGTGLRPGRRFLPNFDKFDRTLLNFNRTLSNFDRIF